jgi:hypothetical protein
LGPNRLSTITKYPYSLADTYFMICDG